MQPQEINVTKMAYCRLKYSISFPIFILLISLFPHAIEGHGRLIEPPSRASAWRYGFDTLANYNDHELFCGGFTKQHQKNGNFQIS